jgi:hypothetical protein
MQTALPEALEARFYHLFYFLLLGVICALLAFVFLHTQACLVRAQRRVRVLVLRNLKRELKPPASTSAASTAVAVPEGMLQELGSSFKSFQRMYFIRIPLFFVSLAEVAEAELTPEESGADGANVDSDEGIDDYSKPGCFEPVLQAIASSSRIGPWFMSNVSFPNFIGDFISSPSLNVLADLWSESDLRKNTLSAKDWFSGGQSGFYFNLLVFIIYRFFFTAVSLSVPVPGGLLIPTMVIGAGVGRLVGELMGLGAVSYGAGVFAVVGAAGFCAAVTQSLSLIIIV